MNKKWLIVGLFVVLALGVGVFFYVSSSDDEQTVQTVEEVPAEEPAIPEEPVVTLVYKAFSDLEGVNQGINSSGTIDVQYYDDGRYELLGKFQNLPPLPAGYFFEGWIVKQSPLEFDSTGKTTPGAGGEVINEFSANVDYQSKGFDFYALTIEPDDGNPAPAEHVLEGTLKIVQ